jgi:hypothetical protein
MLRLSEIAGMDRPVRQDDVDDLGKPTQELICDAIDAGRYEEAKALARYFLPEGKALHDLFCDWIWDFLDKIAKREGEEAVFDYLHATQSSWMLKRTWSGFLNLPIKKRVDLSAEIMRSHMCGPKQDGEIVIEEHEDHFALVMDPCGSGGRMRRGDSVNNTPSRLGAPYNFGATSKAYEWSFGEADVPYYCLHCAVNEIVPMELGGHPLWVTDYQADADKPCKWLFYKSAEAIPEKYYERAGKKKPAAGQGKY